MNRQQRTNYSRSKVKTGAPPVPNNIAWSLLNVTGTTITLQIEGSELGLVTNGVPAFEIVGETITAVSSSLAGGVLTLEMSATVPFPSTLALQTPSIALRNRFGGMLNSGFVTLDPPPAPPEASEMTFSSLSGNEITMTISGGGSPYFHNVTWTLENSTQGDTGTCIEISGSNAKFLMNITPNPGDTLAWSTQDSGFRNSGGGGMNGGTEAIP